MKAYIQENGDKISEPLIEIIKQYCYLVIYNFNLIKPKFLL